MNQIYHIRGQKVMLDRDLAELYGIETKVLKQSVRRNIARFPEDFMFELSKEEFDSLRSQIVTSKKGRGGTRYTPMAFAEQGVAMLSSVLNSPQAIQVNIQIIRIFTKLRQALLDNTEIRLDIEQIKNILESHSKKLNNQDKNMEIVFQYLDELSEKKKDPVITERKSIGYKIKGK
jgi:phage regulator Rha-like protein